MAEPIVYPEGCTLNPEIENQTAPGYEQCCCNCIFHIPVHYHCSSRVKPPEELITGPCVCGITKGFACVPPGGERVFDNWGEHSCGCEEYTPRKEIAGSKHNSRVFKPIRRAELNTTTP